MPNIHPLSFVDPSAELSEGVNIGPFCFVEAGVKIGTGCHLDSHVTIKRDTEIGERNFVGQGAVLGGDPQDRKYKGEQTFLKVGNDNVFREYVTLHRATGEGNVTTIGNDCYLMAYSHVGHNATLMDFVTMANNVGVSGYVTIEEMATIGGMTGLHQYVRVGKFAMVGGMSRIVRDCPPFMITEGITQEVHDINAVGLRRMGVTQTQRLALHKACKLLFRSQLGLTNAIETVRREVPTTDEINYLLAFQERLFKGKNGRGDQP